MLYGEIIAVCSEIHTKHINTVVWAECRIVNVESGGAYSDQWGLKVGLLWTGHASAVKSRLSLRQIHVFRIQLRALA